MIINKVFLIEGTADFADEEFVKDASEYFGRPVTYEELLNITVKTGKEAQYVDYQWTYSMTFTVIGSSEMQEIREMRKLVDTKHMDTTPTKIMFENGIPIGE